ncbi:MAG: hypothetical protein ABI960_02225 [Candidatus Eisenbacteria bacterium]
MIRQIASIVLTASLVLTSPAFAQWPDGGALVCGSALNERGVRCLADGLGHLWVGWGENSPADTTIGSLRVTRWNEAGQIVDGFEACGFPLGDTASRSSTDFALAGDSRGGVFVAWMEWRGQASRIMCQHLSAAGTPEAGWPAAGLELADSTVGPENPSAIADGSGGVYVTWVETGDPPNSNTTRPLRGVRLSADGTLQTGWPVGGKSLLLHAALGWPVEADGQGGLFVSGRRYGSGTYSGIYLIRLRSDGGTANGWSPIGNSVTDVGAADWALISDGAGGAYVRWWDGTLHLQHMTGSGGPAPGWPLGGLIPAASVSDPGAMVLDAEGGVYLASMRFVTGANDLFVMRIAADAALAAGWPSGGFRVTFDGEFKQTPLMTTDGEGGVYLLWSTANALMAQRRLPNGTYPLEWPPGGLRLASGIDGLAFPRSAPASAGRILASWATSSASGDDRDSRILLVRGDGQMGATVDVGARPGARLALSAAPNPSAGVTRFGFNLSVPSDLELSVFDLAGRLVWTRGESAVVAGAVQWTWSGLDARGVGLPRGLYFARLRTNHGESRQTIVRL